MVRKNVLRLPRRVASQAALSPLVYQGVIDDNLRPVVTVNEGIVSGNVRRTFVDDPNEFSRWRIQLGVRYFLD